MKFSCIEQRTGIISTQTKLFLAIFENTCKSNELIYWTLSLGFSTWDACKQLLNSLKLVQDLATWGPLVMEPVLSCRAEMQTCCRLVSNIALLLWLPYRIQMPDSGVAQSPVQSGLPRQSNNYTLCACELFAFSPIAGVSEQKGTDSLLIRAVMFNQSKTVKSFLLLSCWFRVVMRNRAPHKEIEFVQFIPFFRRVDLFSLSGFKHGSWWPQGHWFLDWGRGRTHRNLSSASVHFDHCQIFRWWHGVSQHYELIQFCTNRISLPLFNFWVDHWKHAFLTSKAFVYNFGYFYR